jgi:hypothetical protein
MGPLWPAIAGTNPPPLPGIIGFDAGGDLLFYLVEMVIKIMLFLEDHLVK